MKISSLLLSAVIILPPTPAILGKKSTNTLPDPSAAFKTITTNASVYATGAWFIGTKTNWTKLTTNNCVILSNVLCLTLKGSNHFPVLNPTTGWYPLLINPILATNFVRRTIRFVPDWKGTNGLILDESNTFTFTNQLCLSLNGSLFPAIPDSVFNKVQRHSLFINSFDRRTVIFWNPDRKP